MMRTTLGCRGLPDSHECLQALVQLVPRQTQPNHVEHGIVEMLTILLLQFIGDREDIPTEERRKRLPSSPLATTIERDRISARASHSFAIA